MRQSLTLMLGLCLSALTLADAAELTMDGLTEAIRKHNITSLEGLLQSSILPQEYFTNFTLMKESGSAQEGTTERSRVIAFGKNAKLILAWSGDPKDQTLEMAEHREGANAPEFKRITFSSARNTETPSHPSSGDCRSCHGEKTGYIWSSYNFWTGAFGEDTDYLRNDAPVYKKFIESQKRNPRYSRLGLTPEGAPYEEGADPNSKSRYGNKPNQRLSAFLTRRAAKMYYDELSKSPFFRNSQGAILFTMLECQDERLNIDINTELTHLLDQQPFTLIRKSAKELYPPGPLSELRLPRYSDGGGMAIIARLFGGHILRDLVAKNQMKEKDAEKFLENNSDRKDTAYLDELGRLGRPLLNVKKQPAKHAETLKNFCRTLADSLVKPAAAGETVPRNPAPTSPIHDDTPMPSSSQR